MDNQQATEGDLHWLGGILDGEGSFMIGAARDQRQRVHLRPEIHIGNTSVVMVDEITRIVTAHGLPIWVGKTPAGTGRGQHVLNRDCYRVYARGPKRVRRWLTVLLPYVRAKRHEADLLARFVDSRLAGPHVAPYSEQELADYLALRALHGDRRRESSETICQAVRSQRPGAPLGNRNAAKRRSAEEIVRSPVVTRERAAEMTAPRGCIAE